MPTPERYSAFALQTRCDGVNQDATADAAHDRIKQSLDRIAHEVAATVGWTKLFLGLAPRLAVLPEYVLTGFPIREGIAAWRDKATFEPGSFARKCGARVAKRNCLTLAPK